MNTREGEPFNLNAPKPKEDVYVAVDRIFNYHAPDERQLAQIAQVREAAKDLARTILEYVPPSADRTAALRKVREAMMTANAAIVLKGDSL